jgi:hypothetical protein
MDDESYDDLVTKLSELSMVTTKLMMRTVKLESLAHRPIKQTEIKALINRMAALERVMHEQIKDGKPEVRRDSVESSIPTPAGPGPTLKK